MPPTLTGNPHGPHLRNTQPVWRRGGGWQTLQTLEVTNASIRAFVPFWLTDCEELRLDLEGPSGMAYVTYARDAEGNPSVTVNPDLESETVWELAGNDVVKDLFDHPEVSVLSLDVLKEIKKQIQNFDIGAEVDITAIAAANQRWFYLEIKGTRQFVDVQWVLRKTVTVPRTFGTPVAMVGIDKLWSTAQINTAETIPSETLFTIASIPSKSPPSAYTWSWLKKSPTVSRSSSGRFQMIQEWHLDSWSNEIYDLYS